MNTVQITLVTYYELYYCSDKLTGYDNCCQTHRMQLQCLGLLCGMAMPSIILSLSCEYL